MNHAGLLTPAFLPDQPVGYDTEMDLTADSPGWQGRRILALAPSLHLQILLAGPVVAVDVMLFPPCHRGSQVLDDMLQVWPQHKNSMNTEDPRTVIVASIS